MKCPFIIIDDAQLRYFTKVGCISGAALITEQNKYLITRDSELGEKTDFVVIKSRKRPINALLKIIKILKIRRLGMDLENVPYGVHKKLSKKVRLFDVGAELKKMMEAKSAEEVRRIRNACKLSIEAMKAAHDAIRVGKTERQIRAAAMAAVMDRCEVQAFNFIVASGENSMYTHVFPTNKKIAAGEMVIVDLGVVVDGYHSDMTRTFCISPNREQEKIYDVVLEAQRIAVKNIKEGKKCSAIYNAVEKYFKKQGVEKFWKYDLGHGVGLKIHESPGFSKDSKDVLRRGMTFTIEPGLHIPDVGGVRIEDTVWLDKKPALLTKYPYRLKA